MSNWVEKTSNSAIVYGGSASQYYWNDPPNPGAYFDPGLGTYDLALPTCTTYAYGRVLEAGDPYPITGWHNASAWHAYVTNGWQAVPFVGHSDEIVPGDILELTGSNNHVFVVERVISTRYWVITESYYTSDNGTASGDRSPGVWGSTKSSVNAYGLANYNYRYWHSRVYDCRTANSPDLWPDYILLNPNRHNEPQPVYTPFNKQKRQRRIIRYV